MNKAASIEDARGQWECNSRLRKLPKLSEWCCQ